MKRNPMPSRYRVHRNKVTVGGVKLYLEVGCHKNGQVGAIFLDVEKTGSDLRAALNTIAILVSLGLQDGTSLERYVNILRDTKVGRGGFVTGDERIKMSCSLTDYVARHLGVYYAGREDLANVPAKEAL